MTQSTTTSSASRRAGEVSVSETAPQLETPESPSVPEEAPRREQDSPETPERPAPPPRKE